MHERVTGILDHRHGGSRVMLEEADGAYDCRQGGVRVEVRARRKWP